ncbi:MAG: PQQ-dependent sugar dehydrogenase [Anaerolineae bacterium]|nr:PQQ-dependent sugar dehydrogenase [Anaerolineae bacterium]
MRSPSIRNLSVVIVAGVLALIGWSLLATGSSSVATETFDAETPAVLPDVSITVDEIVASGFNQPVQVTHAGDGSNRLFVVEQPGRIKVIQGGSVLSTPFLDITSLVYYGGERGLLGVAFHPDYESNGYFYVNYTNLSGDTVIARYAVSADPNRADASSAFTLLTVDQPYSNHNGGQLLFGPRDGYLYIGMGDGGSGGDPLNSGQDINTLLGAMLRIDVDGGTPYAIPPDNPYVGKLGRDEIWAIGLRNPWRFSFDRVTGDLYIGDVGQNLWEEISYQAWDTPGGVNFGWRCREGTHTYSTSPPCNDPVLLASLTDPIAEYSHNEGRSVTGGFVYRGILYPDLTGRYFYADYVDGKVWSLYKVSSNPDTWSAPELELDTSFNVSAFGEDEQGELYVVDRSGGTIRRLADVNGPSPNLSGSKKAPSVTGADPGEVVTYTISLRNTGALVAQTAFVTDTVPVGLGYVSGSLTATAGSVDESGRPLLRWHGLLSWSPVITVTYRVTVTGQVTGSIVNQAQLAGTSFVPFTLTSAIFTPQSVLTTTQTDFFLPGTQPGGLAAEIAPPIDCDTCHSAPIYDEWRGTMMSQAGRDSLMWAALFVANADAPSSGDYCLRCHTAKGWLEGRSHPADGSALQGEDIVAGVSCALCHRLVDPVPSTTDQAVAIDAGVRAALTSTVPITHVSSAMMIVDPQDRRRGPFELASTFPYHSAYRADFLGQSGDPVTQSRLCGTCHNLDNPALSWDESRGQYWPSETDLAAFSFEKGQLFPIERTYDEWLNGQYATTGVYAPQFAGDKPDGIVRSCQDCHLRRTTGAAADEQFNPLPRDCVTTDCLPEHDMTGGNAWMPQLLQDAQWRLQAAGEGDYLDDTVTRAQGMLRRAASLTVTLVTSGTQKVALVRVINETGHKLPTGYPEGRRMWLNLRAFDADGNLVYESGAYDWTTGVLTADADVKIYEVKQGLTPEFAALLGLPAGESFHFVLNNTVVKDNRIPPRGYTQAAFDQPGLRSVGATYLDGQHWDDTVYTLPSAAESVIVTLYYQTASREYVDFLRTMGGVDGVALGALWDGSKSQPEVMVTAYFPDYPRYLPLVCRDW